MHKKTVVHLDIDNQLGFVCSSQLSMVTIQVDRKLAKKSLCFSCRCHCHSRASYHTIIARPRENVKILQKHLGFNPYLSGLQCEANNAKDKSKWIASLKKLGITAGVQGTVPGMFASLVGHNRPSIWIESHKWSAPLILANWGCLVYGASKIYDASCII